MSTWFAALVAMAVVSTTYFLCLRPAMQRQRCGRERGGSAADSETERELAQLREAVRMMRACSRRPRSRLGPRHG